jgi:hypothetical protein
MARSISMKNKSRRRRGQRGGFSPENNKKYIAVDVLKLYHERGEGKKVKMLMDMYNKDDYIITPESLELCGDELFTEYMDNLKYLKDKNLIQGHRLGQFNLFYNDLLKKCGKPTISIDGGSKSIGSRRRRTHKK